MVNFGFIQEEYTANPVSRQVENPKFFLFLLRIGALSGPHALRKTFGSWLVQAGEPMTGVSRLLGHSSVVVTERHYAELEPGHRGKLDEI